VPLDFEVELIQKLLIVSPQRFSYQFQPRLSDTKYGSNVILFVIMEFSERSEFCGDIIHCCSGCFVNKNLSIANKRKNRKNFLKTSKKIIKWYIHKLFLIGIIQS